MARPVLGDLKDYSFNEFKRSSHYSALVHPLVVKIQYPDNFVRRIFDTAFDYGRISKMNHPLTTDEAVQTGLPTEKEIIEWCKKNNVEFDTFGDEFTKFIDFIQTPLKRKK